MNHGSRYRLIITAAVFAAGSATSSSWAQSIEAIDFERPGTADGGLLAMLQVDEQGPAEAAADGDGQALGAWNAGTWTIQWSGSALFGDDDKGELYGGHVGFGYYFVDDLSINVEGLGLAVDSAVDDDGVAGGFDLLFRWRAIGDERFSIYFDGGAGIQQATTNYPSDNHFNFRLLFGVGASVHLTGSTYLTGGVRYLHISNAGITDGNNGFDGVMVYLGLLYAY